MKTHEVKLGVDEFFMDVSVCLHIYMWLLSTYSSCREGMSANIPSVISDMDPLTRLLSANRHKQHNLSSGTVYCGSANCGAACGAQHISCSYSQRCDIIRDGPGDLGGTDAHDGVLGAGAS